MFAAWTIESLRYATDLQVFIIVTCIVAIGFIVMWTLLDLFFNGFHRTKADQRHAEWQRDEALTAEYKRQLYKNQGGEHK